MGNYLADYEGNVIMDLNAAAAGHVLGYQYDVFQRDFINSQLYQRSVKGAAQQSVADQADVIREQVMPCAPEGQYHVHIGEKGTGTEANELAINAALNFYAK